MVAKAFLAIGALLALPFCLIVYMQYVDWVLLNYGAF